MANQLNQPLCVIMLQAQMALKTLNQLIPEDQTVKDQTKLIISQAERAGRIVSRIKHLSSPKSGRSEIFDIGETIRRSAQIMKPKIIERGLKVQLTLSETPPVKAAAVQIELVIMKLVENAVDAIEQSENREKNITVSTKTLL